MSGKALRFKEGDVVTHDHYPGMTCTVVIPDTATGCENLVTTKVKVADGLYDFFLTTDQNAFRLLEIAENHENR